MANLFRAEVREDVTEGRSAAGSQLGGLALFSAPTPSRSKPWWLEAGRSVEPKRGTPGCNRWRLPKWTAAEGDRGEELDDRGRLDASFRPEFPKIDEPSWAGGGTVASPRRGPASSPTRGRATSGIERAAKLARYRSRTPAARDEPGPPRGEAHPVRPGSVARRQCDRCSRFRPSPYRLRRNVIRSARSASLSGSSS